jgi:hypothetical protein
MARLTKIDNNIGILSMLLSAIAVSVIFSGRLSHFISFTFLVGVSTFLLLVNI